MEEQRNTGQELSEEELGTITAGAASAKAKMMQLTCIKCGQTFFADITKNVVKCKHCGEPKKLAG